MAMDSKAFGAVVVLALGCMTPTFGWTQDMTPQPVTNGGPNRTPPWSSYPRVEFPERAMADGVEEGRVMLNCLVQSDGRMSDCTIVSEEPAARGFGRQALVGIPYARLTPQAVEGLPPNARVTFPINFTLAPRPAENENPSE